ncbi:MAG TPA: N-acetyl-gamma-glutamyl-phosphate reductase [Ktedonobacterales bacterium]|nr:N-acetyl-gamma-glutamyl-phosphate reductase [Ktedonobacterales bacterium]
MGQSRIPVAVVNGTGYGGVELLRLLAHSPTFELVEVTARSEAGKPVAAVFPHLADLGLTFTPRVERAGLVFVALPDDAATGIVPELLAAGRRVVDLSAAFRLRAPALYPRWYGYEHPAPALLETAVYGLAEYARDALPDARLVAVPGCYPTAALLGLLPALRAGLIEPDVIVDAKSGVSGAGRALKLTTHFSEVNEDVSAYSLDGHRHQPEIAQELAGAAPDAHIRLTFTPHLVPMTRGILATCYAPLAHGATASAIRDAYIAAYAGTPFVRVADAPPHTKWTLASNRCYVYPTVDAAGERLIVVSVLDNLVKGAAGQAIQCANIMCAVPETEGLPVEGVYP